MREAAPSLRHYVARSASICMLGLVLNQVAAQLGGAFLARLIPDPRVYGELSLLLQFLNLAALGLGLGLNSALVYDVATGRAEPGRSFATAWRATIVFTSALVALSDLAAPFMARAYGVPGLTLAIDLGSLVFFAQGLLNLTTSLQSGLRRFGLQTGLMVAGTILATVGRLALIPAVAAGGSVGWLALAGGAGTALAAIAGLWLAAQTGLPGTVHGLRDAWTEAARMLRYGTPLWASNLLKSFQQPYLVLLAGGAGVAAAGFMANDVALLGWPFLVTWAFRLVAVPLIASAASQDERRERTTVCFRLNHLALFPVVALCLFWPREIVGAIYGARYAAAGALLPLLALGVYGSSVGRLATDALAAVGRSQASVPIMLVSSLPLLAVGPLALSRGTTWLAALYCAGWLLSGAYAYLLLTRIGLGVQLRSGFVEPLVPTLAASALAAWAGRLHAGEAATAYALAGCAWLGLSAAVYRLGGGLGRGAGALVGVAAPAGAESAKARPLNRQTPPSTDSPANAGLSP